MEYEEKFKQMEQKILRDEIWSTTYCLATGLKSPHAYMDVVHKFPPNGTPPRFFDRAIPIEPFPFPLLPSYS
jgi:hypothetical protein